MTRAFAFAFERELARARARASSGFSQLEKLYSARGIFTGVVAFAVSLATSSPLRSEIRP